MAVENSENNIRETALLHCIEEETKHKTDPNDTHERSIIIIGSKGVGKTTMVYRFLEKDDTAKPTIAVDYSFGRKAGKSLVKSIVHVWEVGHLASSLISAALTGSTLTHSPHHTTLLMMIDLSKPEELWSTLEESLFVLKNALKMSYDETLISEMKRRRYKELRKDVEKEADPFPMRMCIIGGKYDEFKELDMDVRQLTGKVLRAVAHSLRAGLHYHSAKDKTLVRRTKDVLSHYGFGVPYADHKCMDFEKPLMVPAGADNFSLIDLPISHSRPSAILDIIKQVYTSRIPQVSKNDGLVLEDPSNDPNFNEPVIDRLRVQREEEIGVLLHEMLEGRTPKIPIPDPF